MPSNHDDTPSPGVVSDPTELLLSISDAAAYLSVSRKFLERLIYTERTLPAVRVSGTRMMRVRRSDLDALLEPVVNP